MSESADEVRWLPAKGDRPEGLYVQAGGAIGRIKASLRLSGEDLEPIEISRALRCEPTQSHRRGDPVTKGRSETRRRGLWCLVSDLAETAPLAAHVERLLSQVTGDTAVWSQLSKYYPDVFVGLFLTRWNQGDKLNGATLAQLGELGIALSLDIYSRPVEQPSA